MKFVGRIVTLIFCTLFVHRAYSDSALEHIQKMEQLQATELSKMVARVHQKLSELMLYDDTYQDAAEAQRASVVAKAARSPAAITKQSTGQTEDGLPVHSFRTLLADLATLTRNTLVTAIDPERSFTLSARPTPTIYLAKSVTSMITKAGSSA